MTPFLREEAEGRPSFGRKPKDVLFSKQVRFLRLPSASFGFLRKAATPPEVKLSEGRRRTPSFLRKAATPPEVKLSEGSRRKRRTPFLREEAEGRPSFGRKPKNVLFSKQVQKAEGSETSSLPSESRQR